MIINENIVVFNCNLILILILKVVVFLGILLYYAKNERKTKGKNYH